MSPITIELKVSKLQHSVVLSLWRNSFLAALPLIYICYLNSGFVARTLAVANSSLVTFSNSGKKLKDEHKCCRRARAIDAKSWWATSPVSSFTGDTGEISVTSAPGFVDLPFDYFVNENPSVFPLLCTSSFISVMWFSIDWDKPHSLEKIVWSLTSVHISLILF
jgi:hypothetical protein